MFLLQPEEKPLKISAGSVFTVCKRIQRWGKPIGAMFRA